MQCAHQSRNGTCVASCSSLSLCVGLFLGLALTRQSGAANSYSPSISSPSSSDISSCSSSTPFNSVSSFRHRLVESGLATHCQLKTTCPLCTLRCSRPPCLQVLFILSRFFFSLSSSSAAYIFCFLLSCTKLQCVQPCHTSNTFWTLPCHLSLALCLISCRCPSATSSFLHPCHLCHLSRSSSDLCQSPTFLCRFLCMQPAEQGP